MPSARLELGTSRSRGWRSDHCATMLFLEVGWFISAIMKLDGEVKDMKLGTPLE